MSLADQLWCPTSVQVTVLQARGLKIKGKGGTNDAFAVMQVGKEKYQTTVAEKSVAPVWKEEATFDLLPGGGGGTERSTLHVHVLHRALVGPDKLLGQAVINLPQLSQDKTRSKTEWFKLLDKTGKADKDRGEVLVDIQFLRNNMTASMFDLSAAGRSKSRLGKFKDKVRGKKKDSDASSTAAPSFPQVLTDSEDEEGNWDGEGAAGKEEKKKKKKKIKSLFSPKTNLQKNMSQSMSVLPAKNSLSGSQSSGLNVDASEGKKKFKFMIHKRSGSSGAKDFSSAPQKAAEQRNMCINGSHVYYDEPQNRTSRIGSNFSLTSSGHGSMEDVPDSSPPSVDSVRTTRQYSPWTEEEISESLKEGEEEEETQIEEEKVYVEEGVEKENARKKEEKILKEEEMRQEEEKRRLEEKQRWHEEKVRKEEEMIRMEERKKEQRLEEEKRWEEEKKRENEESRKDMERKRLEVEERRRLEEEERRRLEEEERRRLEVEERRRLEEEERRRLEVEEEEERRRLEVEERRRLEVEERRRLEVEEERRRLEVEEERRRLEVEEERRRLEVEEERRRLEVEERKRLEVEEERRRLEVEEERRRLEVEEERRRLEEEERRRLEEEERRRLEVEEERRRLEVEEERRRLEVEERKRLEEEEEKRLEEEEEKRLEEERRRLEEEERRLEQKARKEEEKKKEMERVEEEMRKEERRMEEEKRKQEEKRNIEERFKEEMLERHEQEKRRQDSDEEKEEKARRDMEGYARMMTEIKKQEEEEREQMITEKTKEKEDQRIWKEEEDRARKEREEEERSLAENKEEVGKKAENFPSEEQMKKVTQIKSDVINSLNPFDENYSPPAGSRTSPSAASLLRPRTSSSDDKDQGGSQREKRPAPQPPGKHQAPRGPQGSPPRADRRSADIGTVPQKSVQAISPVSRSDPQNTMHSSAMNITLMGAKHGKGPAPSRPCPGARAPPTSNISHTSSLDVKQAPISYGLNPFEDEDEDEANFGPAQWPPAAASNSKFKSSKKAHAPPLPELCDTPSTSVGLNPRGDPDPVVVVGDDHKVLPCDPGSISEAKPVIPQDSGGKREEPPTTKRRLLPVKPLNPLRQAVNQGGKDIQAFGILSDDLKNTKGEPELKGPYSQLTKAELISLVVKQDNQLLEKDKKVSELERYIDNLLVRVMEEQPSILMSMNTLKKSV